ncbi:MAG TPA: MHYT domain-containing protein, partial [Allosphingosinicella sp.]
MLRVFTCIVHEHDLRLVLVAGLICLLATFTAFATFERARAATRRRGLWIALAAFVSGTGIWSTHFVAMLAFQPDLPIGYDLDLTLLSIAAAIVISGCGWQLALRRGRIAPVAAGVAIGLGIGTMHYVGMAAVNLA